MNLGGGGELLSFLLLLLHLSAERSQTVSVPGLEAPAQGSFQRGAGADAGTAGALQLVSTGQPCRPSQRAGRSSCV